MIVDYEGNPYVLIGEGAATSTEPATEFEVKCGLGESDVKVLRYLPLGNLLIVSCDGDSVPIACGSMERLGKSAPEIFVKRIKIDVSNAAIAATNAARGIEPVARPKGNKRPISEVTPATTGAVVAEKKKRSYEYVDIGMVVNAMRTIVGPYTPNTLKPYTMRIMTHAINLSGSDFGGGVPWLNGLASIRNVKILWPGLCSAATVHGELIKMDPGLVAEEYIGKLWKFVQFKKQCKGFERVDFETLYTHLSEHGSISQFRRDRLVSPGELCCLVKGGDWVSSYWTNAERTPCALAGDFGFEMNASKRVVFNTTTPLPPISSKSTRKAPK